MRDHRWNRKDKTIIENEDLNISSEFDVTVNSLNSKDFVKPEIGQKLYNLNQLNEIGRGDEQFVKMMLEMFTKLANQTIEQMLSAYALADIDVIKKLAHKIKPSIDNLGIESLHDKIREMEVYDITKNSNEELKQILDEVVSVLKAVIADIS